MNITEKLTTVANNVPLVYNAGYVKGKTENGEAYVFKNMNSLNYFFESGYNSHYTDKFKDLDFSSIYSAQYIFRNNKDVTSIVTPAFSDKLKLIHGMFMGCTALKTVDMSKDMFTARVNVVTDLFNGCTALEKVIGTLDFSKADYASRTFQGCSALQDIRFAENSIKISITFADSPLLTGESVNSIINALINITDGVARTVTFNGAVALTDSQKATIETKGWDLVQ